MKKTSLNMLSAVRETLYSELWGLIDDNTSVSALVFTVWPCHFITDCIAAWPSNHLSLMIPACKWWTTGGTSHKHAPHLNFTDVYGGLSGINGPGSHGLQNNFIAIARNNTCWYYVILQTNHLQDNCCTTMPFLCISNDIISFQLFCLECERVHHVKCFLCH